MAIYKANIPQPGDLISVSQADLLNNFIYLNTMLDREHVQAPQDTANAQIGGHRFMSMVDQFPTIPTIPPSSAAVLYTFNQGLFFTNSGGQTVQLAVLPQQLGMNGYNQVAGGLLFQWGVTTVNTVNFKTVFPIQYTVGGVGSPAYNVQCTVYQNTTNRHFCYVRSISSDGTGFRTANLDSGGNDEVQTFLWTSIGPRT
jgi:hypothetical protein